MSREQNQKDSIDDGDRSRSTSQPGAQGDQRLKNPQLISRFGLHLFINPEATFQVVIQYIQINKLTVDDLVAIYYSSLEWGEKVKLGEMVVLKGSDLKLSGSQKQFNDAISAAIFGKESHNNAMFNEQLALLKQMLEKADDPRTLLDFQDPQAQVQHCIVRRVLVLWNWLSYFYILVQVKT